MTRFGSFVRFSEALGRPGSDLMNVVWPTPEVRYVACQRFHPYSGEPKVAVRVMGPEIRERPNAKLVLPVAKSRPYELEVHFEQRDVKTAELFANKCLVVMSVLQVEGAQITREDFYNRACQLLANDIHKGLMPAGRRVTHTREHVAEIKDRSRVARKSF